MIPTDNTENRGTEATQLAGEQGLPGVGRSISNLLISFSQVRALVADFSIIFSILMFCGIDACFGLATPKLLVPSVIKVCPWPLHWAFSLPAL